LPDWHAALTSANRRELGAERVEFDPDDPGHVLVLTEQAGDPVWHRYALSPEAQQFLRGEFPEGGVPLRLLAPRSLSP
jgi:hypothetical protein